MVIAAVLYGPLAGGIVGALSDFIGALLFAFRLTLQLGDLLIAGFNPFIQPAALNEQHGH